MRSVKQEIELWSITPDSESLIERAGRICYKSESKEQLDAFIQMLISRGHDSVLEHASATFWIKTDRGISHEIVRHRLASYSQESTRYCNYAGQEMEYISPDIDIDINMLEEQYNQLILNGATPQQARDILPTCLKTEIVMTANFREWRHFLKLRMSKAAHPKIQIIAKMIWLELLEAAPSVFKDLEVK